MLIALVIILLLIWAAVVWSIYSNFTVFYSNFAESESYHRAYYSSISALERAELVIKQRQPWFEWNGWWKIWQERWEWTLTYWGSDGIIQNFSYLSNTESPNTSTIFRDIKSRTTRIPSEWNWDIDSMLSYTDVENPSNNSENFNMMDYKDSQVFLLYYDNWKSDGTTNDNPYNKISCKNWSSSCTQSNTTAIIWTIRLPWKLKDSFEELNEDKPLITGWPNNDAIVDRQIRWRYQENPETHTDTYPFTIYSTQNYFSGTVYNNLDSAIREIDINWDETDPQLNFNFWQNKWSPTLRWVDSQLTIINPKETTIKNDNNVKNNRFVGILNGNNYNEKQLRFSLLNLLKSKKDMVYPFLEYYVDFWTTISDKYFTINAEWNYNDYKINRIIRKPTNKESVLWSFTTIF